MNAVYVHITRRDGGPFGQKNPVGSGARTNYLEEAATKLRQINTTVFRMPLTSSRPKDLLKLVA